mmetsp:Transcript_21103/g.43504  ORF Transcript_21103/g.43504 Transcript_21103/m.43504 type:complete len:98 (-) Transcript_21103:33-326(-)
MHKLQTKTRAEELAKGTQHECRHDSAPNRKLMPMLASSRNQSVTRGWLVTKNAKAMGGLRTIKINATDRTLEIGNGPARSVPLIAWASSQSALPSAL